MKKLSLSLIVVALMIATVSCDSPSKRRSEQLAKQEQLKAEKARQQKKFDTAFELLLVNQVGARDVAFWVESAGVAFVVTIPKGESVTLVSGSKKYKGELSSEVKGVMVNNEVRFLNGFIENANDLKFSKKVKATWQEFPSVWSFKDLEPYAKVFELSLWDKELPWQQLENLEAFYFWCEKDGSVIVKPKPAGILTIGKKVNLIGQDGNAWKTREQSMVNRGEFYLPVK